MPHPRARHLLPIDRDVKPLERLRRHVHKIVRPHSDVKTEPQGKGVTRTDLTAVRTVANAASKVLLARTHQNLVGRLYLPAGVTPAPAQTGARS